MNITLKTISDEPLLFAFNPHKTEVALAFKERVSLYDLNPFKKTQDLNFPKPASQHFGLQDLFYSDDGKKIVFSDSNYDTSAIFIWDQKGTLMNPDSINQQIIAPKHTIDNKVQNFIKQGYYSIDFYSLNNNAQIDSIKTEVNVNPLLFSPDNRYIIGVLKNNITVWKTDTKEILFSIPNIVNQQNNDSINWSITTNIETDTYTTDNEIIDPFIALSKDSSRIAIGVPTDVNTGLKNYTLSIYDLKKGTRLYHSSSNLLYTADKNFGAIIFKDEKNPKNFMLKDLTKTTLNVFPGSKAVSPITRGPQSTPIKSQTRRITTSAQASSRVETKPKQETAPLSTPILTPSVIPTAEPVTPSTPQAPQKSWWQRWIGW